MKIAGVCHDSYAQTYFSNEKGYSKCLDDQSRSTGSVNEYWGGAQRQTGLGVMLGQ